MTAPQPDTETLVATLREACEGWPTPNRYTDALDALRSRLAETEAQRDKAREEGEPGYSDGKGGSNPAKRLP